MKANLRKLNGNLSDVSHTEIVLRPSNHPLASGLDQSQTRTQSPLPIQNFPQHFRTNYFPPPPSKLTQGLAKFPSGFRASDPGGFPAERDVTVAPVVSEGGTGLKALTDTIIRGGNLEFEISRASF